MSDADPDELMKAAVVPPMVVTSSIGLAFSCAAVGLVGLQNVTLVQWRFPWMVIPWALVAVAVGGLYVASKLYRGRSWTLPAALALTILMTLGAVGFLILSILSGVLSLLGGIAVPVVVLTLVLEGIAWGPFTELTARRKKMREAGFDLDF
jgi:MFS family permease